MVAAEGGQQFVDVDAMHQDSRVELHRQLGDVLMLGDELMQRLHDRVTGTSARLHLVSSISNQRLLLLRYTQHHSLAQSHDPTTHSPQLFRTYETYFIFEENTRIRISIYLK